MSTRKTSKAAPKKPTAKPAPAKAKVIATRRSCSARGTGLSHYIHMDEKGR